MMMAATIDRERGPGAVEGGARGGCDDEGEAVGGADESGQSALFIALDQQ